MPVRADGVHHGAVLQLAEAERLCGQIGVIRAGRLVAVGAPHELRARRGGGQVEVLGRGFTPDLVSALRTQPSVRSVETSNGGLLLGLVDGSEVAPLVTLLVRGGAEVEEVRKTTASLEEIFLELMEEG